jgi:hypothetical protein
MRRATVFTRSNLPNNKFSVTLVKVHRLQEEQAISHFHHLIFSVAALTIKSKTMGGHAEEEGRTLVRPEPELCDDESEGEEERKEEIGKCEEDLEEGEKFYNKLQHADQAMAVEERPTK